MLRCLSILLLSGLLLVGGGCGTHDDGLTDPEGGVEGLNKTSEQRSDKPGQGSLEILSGPSVQLDIRPGSCPNNLNPKSRGKLKVALLGSPDFDVNDVDHSTLLLEGVAPGKHRVKDLIGLGAAEDGCYDSAGGPDGYADLFLDFTTSEVCEAAGDLFPGSGTTLTLTGALLDGSTFTGEDGVRVVGKQVDPGPLGPTNPDELMQVFQAAYENMDFDALRSILHPDFLMILQQSTVEEFPDLGTTLDVNEELRIGQRMFAGDPVVDPNGDLVPGISGISFSRFYPLAPWQLSAPEDLIPNAIHAPFEVEIWMDRGQTYSTLKVQGIIHFYLAYQELEIKGESLFHYQMIGQRDLTNLHKTEGTSWGTVKALFR